MNKRNLLLAAMGAIAFVVFGLFPPAQDANAGSSYRRAYSFEYTATTTATRVQENSGDYYDEIRCSPQASGTVLFGSATRITYPVGDCTYCDAKLSMKVRTVYGKTSSGSLVMDCLGLVR